MHVPTGKAVFEKLMAEAPAFAVTEPPQPLLTFGVGATIKPVDRVSVKLASIGTTLGLLMVKVTVVTPLIGIVVGLKLLLIEGGSRMIMPALAVPPLELPNPELPAVYENVVVVG